MCRMLTKVCAQLLRNEIRDVGVMATPNSAEFFRKCGFGKDRFGAVGMQLASGASLRS